MDELIQAVTSQIAGALAVLVPALVALARVWLSARSAKLEAERQAAIGAVCEVEATTREPVQLSGQAKKHLAMERVAARLPGASKLDPAALSRLVQDAYEGERRASTSLPPPPRVPSGLPQLTDDGEEVDEDRRVTTPETPSSKR